MDQRVNQWSVADYCSQTEHGRIPDPPAVDLARIGDATAWPERILNVRLHGNAGSDNGLITELQQGLAAAPPT